MEKCFFRMELYSSVKNFMQKEEKRVRVLEFSEFLKENFYLELDQFIFQLGKQVRFKSLGCIDFLIK